MYSSRWNVTLGATICHAFFIGLVYILPSVILSSVREDLHLSVSLGCYWIDMVVESVFSPVYVLLAFYPFVIVG
ncbi:uncharacterized protein Gasu_55000 [Galdieria sulphuraria]|uniref:Uncharacterized protein n=1 Tax=Galdieria sulphuraria TaxID=130081 RepID=M2WST5_GALSU|nr:uncharacterized protein Gasu_55000 [Galdieria sulphuraria]EME26930.1 hypothetical protein Gasu_55000 [Galdieria sulphuraria]|eukprot:XP_005703450.1 hypothetical protein Gasu_55000 [Galdieria sulphuraria]